MPFIYPIFNYVPPQINNSGIGRLRPPSHPGKPTRTKGDVTSHEDMAPSLGNRRTNSLAELQLRDTCRRSGPIITVPDAGGNTLELKPAYNGLLIFHKSAATPVTVGSPPLIQSGPHYWPQPLTSSLPN